MWPVWETIRQWRKWFLYHLSRTEPAVFHLRGRFTTSYLPLLFVHVPVIRDSVKRYASFFFNFKLKQMFVKQTFVNTSYVPRRMNVTQQRTHCPGNHCRSGYFDLQTSVVVEHSGNVKVIFNKALKATYLYISCCIHCRKFYFMNVLF